MWFACVIISTLNPFLEVEIARTVEWDCILVKQIGHHDKVAIRCKLVGNQL
jgi:hypothetical protein